MADRKTDARRGLRDVRRYPAWPGRRGHRELDFQRTGNRRVRKTRLPGNGDGWRDRSGQHRAPDSQSVPAALKYRRARGLLMSWTSARRSILNSRTNSHKFGDGAGISASAALLLSRTAPSSGALSAPAYPAAASTSPNASPGPRRGIVTNPEPRHQGFQPPGGLERN